MKVRKLIDSFNYAIDGIIYALRTQRNMRIHFIVALIILSACFVYDISKIEFIILAITITMVIAAELVNTAIESAIDLSTNYYHPLAKVAKNTAAGAVLITAINAVLVGYIIFWDELTNITFRIMDRVKETEAYFGEGTPLKGGMPSGHSAIAFSIATAISLISNSHIIIILSYLMALITAQSRVDSEVHSVWEVIAGAILGTLITILIFKIFSW